MAYYLIYQTVIVSSTVQSFFGWRVHKLTGQTWLAALIGVSAIVQFCKLVCSRGGIRMLRESHLVLGTGVGIACGIIKEFTKFHVRADDLFQKPLLTVKFRNSHLSLLFGWFLLRLRISPSALHLFGKSVELLDLIH